MTYDGDARLASVTDPHGFTESYEYEPSGELKKVVDKLLRPTTWSHDQLGRVSAMVDTLGRRHDHAYTVPAAGAWVGPTLMAGSADATSSTTSLAGALRDGDYQIGHNAYPAYGYPAQVSLYRDATFELGYSEYFDPAERMLRRRDRVGLAIDAATVPPQTSFGTQLDEQFTWSTQTSTPVLTSMSSTNPADVQSSLTARDFWFDATSESSYWGVSDPRVDEAFTRDAAGRVTQLRRSYTDQGSGLGAALEQVSTYTYRPDGRIGQITNPDGVHDFTYDSRGLVHTQTVSGEGTYTYGYDEMSRNDVLEYPDGHVRRQSYDELGRITSRCYEYPPDAPRCYTAQYDAVGNPVRMTDPDGEDVLEYDGLDRLTKVTRSAGGAVVSVEDYAFNALGALSVNASVAVDHQRPRLDGGGVADAAVPATLGGQPVVLDAGGRVTSLRGASLEWSRKGFVRSEQEPGPVLPVRYGVDAQLRRFAKAEGATYATTRRELYVYEGLDRVATIVQEAGSSTGVVAESWVFDGIDHPLRIKQGATTAYYELDLAGNVRALRASGGASLGSYRYTAFGKTAEDTAAIEQPLRWKGRWHQDFGGTEVYDVRARQWAPELGVFLSVDELQYFRPNWTLWSWPNQSPIRYSDPSGHGVEECVAAAIALYWSCLWGGKTSAEGCLQLCANLIEMCFHNIPPPPKPSGSCGCKKPN